VGGAPSSLSVIVDTTSAPITLTWDGRSDAGSYVSPGHYELGIHWDSGENGSQDFVRGILVTGHVDSQAPFIQPNKLDGTTGYTATFMSGDPQTQELSVHIYTLAGELVFKDRKAVGALTWDGSSVASGIYIALIESWGSNGVFLGHETLKIAVLK
jgi:flagellar hook assembly protein FlgD